MCLIFILALAYFFWGQNGSEKCPIFIILTFYDFKTMFPKNFCDEVSKIKNPRCSFSSIFHADPQEIFFVWHFQPFLVENWPRKWAIFIFFIISWYLKISQYVLHKSVWRNFQNKKIWDVHLLCFSMLILMRYFLFAISYCFWWKIDLENGQFSNFS